MKSLVGLIVAIALGHPASAGLAQDDRVMQALRSALAPALQQFPETDDSGASPRGGNTDALWMVRPPEAGERIIEVIANPLNEANQAKANRAMAQIERNIEAAQRRAAAQYEAAVAEAKRTGKSQDVDGVTLGDEGIDGAKIDAESHLTIEVLFNQPVYKFTIASSIEPRASTVKLPGVVFAVTANTYKDDRGERYAEAETVVFLGSVAAPSSNKTGDHSYELSAAVKPSSAPISSLVVRMKGNDALMADLLRKADWNALLELIK
jgi:hypothetical protein